MFFEKYRTTDRRNTTKKGFVGPHRDDMAIMINGFLAKKFASKGQARSIVIALKLAELNFC